MAPHADADISIRQKALAKINGARLTSVQFVLDYLILGFDEKGALTTAVWPELLGDGASLRFGEAGYRDRLCSFIELHVLQATIDEEEVISIYLEYGFCVRIPLRSGQAGKEHAILTGPNHALLTF